MRAREGGKHTAEGPVAILQAICHIATGRAAPKKAARRPRLSLLGKPPGHSLLPSLCKTNAGATNLARHLQPLSNQSCRMFETLSPGRTYTGWRSDVTGQQIIHAFAFQTDEKKKLI